LQFGLAGTAAPPGVFAPPPPAVLARHFPQLEILELRGQGGMGAVYKARQVVLDRLVALKVLPPESGRDPAFAERFRREARALARLNHPHIVAVYDFGETDGFYYFLMEFVDGVNLRQLLHGGHLQPHEALRIVPQLCEALQYAHDEGIVHRDIKPENILVDRAGNVKIADFGLAKLLGQPPVAHSLTGSHQVMGTLHYIAPEQMEKPLAVDHRADIYSLGVVFYEMLTGELPLGRFAPPSQKAGVDVRLDEVVLRALEKEPGRRYQHVSEVKSEVESITQDSTGQPGCEPQVVEIAVRDIGATVGILGGLALIALAVGMTQSAAPLWGLCLIIWLASDFPWATRFKVVAGVLGMVGELALIAFAVFWLHSAIPLLALILLIWFARDFPWPGKEEESIESVTALGLVDDEQRLREFLVQHPQEYLFAVGKIPAERLSAGRKVCRVPAVERVLGLVDLTYEENATHCLLFGCQGIYYHNAPGSDCAETGAIRYDEFPSRAFVNHGTHVYLGNDQYLCPEADWCEYYPDGCEFIAQILSAVRQAIQARPQ
jgi:predicted Ser/Thr protein kinase